MPHPSRFSTRVNRAGGFAILLFLTVLPLTFAQEVAQRMGAAADSFLGSLDESQLSLALHAFDEQRKDWHFVPRERSGLPLSAMSESQRQLAFGLIAEGLSEQGVQSVEDIRSLETALQRIEGTGRSFERDPENYHLFVFARPNLEKWGWRFEGHHLSINATIVDGESVAMSPRFLGANPAEVPSGERKGFRALGDEEDIAFALAESLSAGQREKALFRSSAPRDIFTGAHRKVDPLPVEGIAYGDLDTRQQRLIRDLVLCYLSKVKAPLRKAALAEIEADSWNAIRFGWAGPIDRSRGNYYFLQSSRFLIEYDNTQNGNNHIHSVWRDFDGDFGEDLIQAHRLEHAH